MQAIKNDKEDLLEIFKTIIDNDLLEFIGGYIKVNSAQDDCYVPLTERQFELLDKFKSKGI